MLISLFISFLLTLIIVFLPARWTSNHGDLTGVQKFHFEPTPRIAGIPVFVGFFVGLWFVDLPEGFYLAILFASLPVFVFGLAEDITSRISPRLRMLATLMSVAAVFFWLDIGITMLGFGWVDGYLSGYFVLSLLFTLLVVGGLVNAMNIIDGYNGLMVGYFVLVMFAI